MIAINGLDLLIGFVVLGLYLAGISYLQRSVDRDRQR
jgi:hypothetical protein